ncbi:MAG: thiol reductase thioredoxin [Desulfatitalea sp.]|nr:thiol reductase thioredoxin [Desulfatitalea sp.]
MDTMIVHCPHCHAKNRVPENKRADTAKCGRCHKFLPSLDSNQDVDGPLALRCSQCHVKNRVPGSKLHEDPKCGRCGAALEHRGLLSGKPVMVSDANFNEMVLASPLPVLLYGWAPWCSVCSSTGPMVTELAMQTRGTVRIGKVNIDANPKLASQYNILSVPSFFIFDAGKLKKHIPGAVPKHELMMQMAPFV